MSTIENKVLKLAKRKFYRGDYQDCEELSLIYLKENERDLDARLLLANSFYEAEKLEPARLQLETIRHFSDLSGEICEGVEELQNKIESSENTPLDEKKVGEPCAEKPVTEVPDEEGIAIEEERIESIRATRGLSPYFGFPEKANVKGQTNNYGFIYSKHRGLIDCPYVASESEYLVSIFGGSVASGFFQDCAEYVENILSAHPDLAGRDVVLLNFATGAVKQPQQLIYLNYFAGIGQKFDLVVNLDGINDMAGAIGNYHEGHHPAMPTVTLSNAFEGLTSVPKLNQVSLKYFMNLAKSEQRLKAINEGVWKYFTPNFVLDQLSQKIEDLRSRPPREMNANPILEVHRIEPRDYMSADAPGRDEMRFFALDLWERCAEMMMLTCDWIGARYVHAVQPNHYYCKKPLDGEDAQIMDEGFSEQFQLMVNDTWPEMIRRARGFDRKYPVYCHMTDVFDEMNEPIFRDAICHFTPKGHMAMADRLCDFLMKQKLSQD